jgi:hypothetical protein
MRYRGGIGLLGIGIKNFVLNEFKFKKLGREIKSTLVARRQHIYHGPIIFTAVAIGG